MVMPKRGRPTNGGQPPEEPPKPPYPEQTQSGYTGDPTQRPGYTGKPPESKARMLAEDLAKILTAGSAAQQGLQDVGSRLQTVEGSLTRLTETLATHAKGDEEKYTLIEGALTAVKTSITEMSGAISGSLKAESEARERAMEALRAGLPEIIEGTLYNIFEEAKRKAAGQPDQTDR